jgi:hypothetical protein
MTSIAHIARTIALVIGLVIVAAALIGTVVGTALLALVAPNALTVTLAAATLGTFYLGAIHAARGF